jgi:hypothetical protein
MSSVSRNIRPFKADFIFGNSQKSFGAKSGGKDVFHFSSRFLGQKLLDRERLMSWSIVMVGNSIVGPKLGPYSLLLAYLLHGAAYYLKS